MFGVFEHSETHQKAKKTASKKVDLLFYNKYCQSIRVAGQCAVSPGHNWPGRSPPANSARSVVQTHS